MKKRHYIFFTFLLFAYSFHAQTNIDFEATPAGAYTSANAVSGWTISSQTATSCNSSTAWTPGSPEFSVLSTPIVSFPFIGSIPNSPFGGNKIACLNSLTANNSVTKIAHLFSVNSSSAALQIAFAGVWQNGTHSCCEEAGFTIQLFDSLGNSIPCSSPLVKGPACQSYISFSTTATTKWTNWQIKYVDLSSYIGTNVKLEITSSDCTVDNHFGTLFLDVKLGTFSPCNTCLSLPSSLNGSGTVNFCAGSTQATIAGPYGYLTYTWSAPAGYPVSAAQASLNILSINNASAGNVYTLNATNSNGGCIQTYTYVLSNTTVNILALGSSSTCAGGASGSATVVGSGSGSGYTYTWLNSNNSVVGNYSIMSNLSAGVYSVSVSAAGSQSTSCGTSVNTVTINTSVINLIHLLKPYCGTEAYLNTYGGSNHQWYNNLTAISSSLGGTAPGYTVNAPFNGAVYYLSYFSSQGCQDSIKYTLTPTTPGNVYIPGTQTICPGASNGSVILNIIPAPGAQAGTNYFYVNSIGTTPAYSASVNPTSSNTFSISNLFAGGTYSVNAFDGACKYDTSFSITPFIFDYTLTPSPSPTICQTSNNYIIGNVTHTNSPSQFTYSWVPSPFIFNGYSNFQTAFLTPSTTPGTVSTIIYTVIVTPTAVNCPLTKTLAITLADPPPPNINPIPQLCSNSSQYSINTNPPGGVFLNSNNGAIGSNNGIITPSLSLTVTNTFTYLISIGTCSAQSLGNYIINQAPIISVSGNTLICEGQSTTLYASGASTFTWNIGAQSPSINIVQFAPVSYTVEGTDTLTFCHNTKTVTVNAIPYPAITILGDTVLCAGETIKLSALGANTYSWSTGSSIRTIYITPSASTTYTVMGTSALASCSSTKSVFVSVSPCTSLEKNTFDKQVSVRPNPSSGKYFIGAENILSFVIVDELGKIILEEHFQKQSYEFDLSEYPNGIYTLKLFQNNDEIKTLKLIKTD